MISLTSINRSHDTRGFSLIELIVYITIVSILAFVFVSFTIDLVGNSQRSRVKQDVQQNARHALDRMLQEIRSASAVNVGSSTFNSDPGVLSLATSAPATDPTVFDVSGGVLRITQGGGSPQALTDANLQVSSFIVEDMSVNNRTSHIKITLTIQHPNPEDSPVFDVETTLHGAATVRVESD